jgi:hypothetical protein
MRRIALPSKETVLLALLLGLPPLLVQLRLGVPRLDADAVEYFSHVRSLYFDHDLDFANEFAHFGILTRGDKVHPTPTGHRRTIFSVGPALLWMPFYAVGDLWARASGDVEEGYSKAHIMAVSIASLVYGVIGLLLVKRILQAFVEPAVALWTTLTLLYGTFLFWYMTSEAAVSHALSFFASALVLFVYLRDSETLGLKRGILLGFLIGVAAVVRWQNGVLLLLPAMTLLWRLRSEVRKSLTTGLLTLVAFGLGAFPQMLAWKAIFGSYLLKDPPHGRDFVRLDHPYLLQVFFSSRHGLFFWTPVLWAGFLGYVLVLRQKPRTGLALFLPLLVMTYVNACSGDWWAGGSFSNRRFDSALPFLAVGLACSLSFLVEAARRRPGTLVVLGGGALILFNILFMEVYRRAEIPLDDTVSFPEVWGKTSALVSRTVGSPPAWPANWAFALRHDLPVDQFDLMVGKYLFYRQNNLEGVIAMGDPRADPALLDQGWSSPHPCEEEVCRRVLSRARIFAPLDVPEDLDLVVRARGTGAVALAINGVPAGELSLSPSLTDARVQVPREGWRRELNEVLFSPSPGSEAFVSRLVFLRKARR